MTTIPVICPHCAFSRDLPAGKVPDRPVRATCPQCGQSFEFRKPAAPSPPPLPPDKLPQSSPQKPEPPKPALKKPVWTPPPAPPRLPDVGDSFSEAWRKYQQRWLLLLGLLLAAMIGAALPVAIVGGSVALLGKNDITIDGAPLALLFSLAAIAALITLLRGIAALMAAAVDDGIGFREAVTRGKVSWLALFWVSSLYGFIVSGASLLLVIPGILTMVWFFASPYMAVDGSARGMEALLKSRAIVRDRFWPVLLRLFLVWLLSTVAGMVPFAGPFIALLMVPFTILYQVGLYRSLEETAGKVVYPDGAGDKARWLLLGLAGYLVVPVIAVSLLGLSFSKNLLPLLKQGTSPVSGRQVITIPPPSGDLPAGFSFGGGVGVTSPAGSDATPSTAPAPTIEIGPTAGSAAPGSPHRATDVNVFIYAVNAPGTIRVNGQEFRVIKAEPDMQYNINAFGEHFRAGENSIEFDVTPRAGDGKGLPPNIHMKVSRGGAVLGEWRLSDRDGWPRSVTVAIPEGKSP